MFVLLMFTSLYMVLVPWMYTTTLKAIDSESERYFDQSVTSASLFLESELSTTSRALDVIGQDYLLTMAVSAGDKQIAGKRVYSLLESVQGELLDFLIISLADTQMWFVAELTGENVAFGNELSGGATGTTNWALEKYGDRLDSFVLSRTVPIVDSEFGKVVGFIHGGVILQNNLVLVEQMRRQLNLEGFAIAHNGEIVVSGIPNDPKIIEDVKYSITHDRQGQIMSKGGYVITSRPLNVGNGDLGLWGVFVQNDTTFLDVQNQYIWFIVALFLVTIAFAALAGSGLYRLIGPALNGLLVYSEKVAEGSYSEEYRPGKVEEFNSLGSALQVMVQAIVEKQNYILGLHESATAPVFSFSIDGEVVSCNRAFGTIVGEDIVGSKRSAFDLFDVSQEQLQSLILSLRQGRIITSEEMAVISKNGESRPYVWSFAPVEQADVHSSEWQFIVAQGQDITELNIARDQIIEQQELLNVAFESIPLGALVVTATGEVSRANSSCFELTGYSFKDLNSVENILHAFFPDEDYRNNVRVLLSEAFVEQTTVNELLVVREDSEQVTFAFHTVWLSGSKILITFSDITDQKEEQARLERSRDILEEIVAERTGEIQAVNESLKAEIDARETTEKQLRNSESRFRSIFEQASVGIGQLDLEGYWVQVNDKLCDIIGYSRDELLQMNYQAVTHPEDVQRNISFLNNILSGSAKEYSTEKRYIRKDGVIVWIDLTVGLIRGDDDRPVHYVSVVQDITERKMVEFELEQIKDGLEKSIEARTAELNEANKELTKEIFERKAAEIELQLSAEVFEHSIEGILITDSDGVIVKVNRAFTDITGYSEEEALGQRPSLLKSNHHDPLFYERLWKSLHEKGRWEGEIWNRRKNGEAYPEWLSIGSIKDEDGRTEYYAAVFHDISESKRNEEQIRFMAYHDALTGLPNRLLLLDRLRMAINHAARQEKFVAVLFIDLDNFKNINDSLGHDIGDRLLQTVAVRLQTLAREEDTVGRIGGDEFVIVLESVDAVDDLALVCNRMLDAFQEPILLGTHELFITPSIGVSLYPDDSDNAEVLIKNADMAMYEAKMGGRNGFRLFTQSMNDNVVNRLDVEFRLRKALENDRLTVFFQPRVDAVSGTICGAEALVRWIDEDGSIISPVEFIPLAEETGLIIPLGEMVLRKACDAFRDKILPNLVNDDFILSVNLSARQFEQTEFVSGISAIVAQAGVSPERIELEVTETTIMQNVESSAARLQELCGQGMKIAIDDFGTGHSSLNYLKKFPLHVLKIDRSFIRDILVDADDRNIVEAVVGLARKFDVRVVAEGVEEKEQLNLLQDIGLDEIQGYYFSKPVPIEEFVKLLHQGCLFYR
ncbi:MAG: EAL domain-containing protein [Desulfovibrio sp.]